MPHEKGHKDPAKKANKMGAQAKKSKATKPLKRGDRRPDGSIVGGIAGATKPRKPSKNKPLGKKSVNDSPETEARRVKEYKIAKAQKEAENKKAKEKGKASKAHAKSKASSTAPAKNLGTVSDGTAFYKTGPLYAHEAGHTDPTKEAKAKAAAEAKKKHDASSKVYGKTTKTESTKDGVTTYTMSRPWTKKGTGSGGKNLGPGYKPSAAETARANAAKNSSGVDTRTHKSFKMKPVGIKITPMVPTASIIIPKKPTNTKKTPPPPSLTSFKGKSGTYSLKGIDTSGRGGRKSGSGGGRVCGCK
jgi:colicin import membrane protein